ncbi:cell cycle checkpoint protein RAD17-like isoform X1 [Octopus sinensis]|uniref:Cell cycle checkpoint protein RAD17-like isoform X1 n=1 Tax=Octopus sinensis TaxID=2607531 RepID=A0A7E6EYD3_9MOLL|nr:cell cycle checkpoint protein RAD17-like isoform X1 [Octopus sinensis]XP_036360597.1 cell cycle checkpoint protein RAD17-like isoform X1 [Octopus sinensis]
MKKNTIQCTLFESFSSLQDGMMDSCAAKKKSMQWVSSAFDSGSEQNETQNISNSKALKRSLSCAFSNKSKCKPPSYSNCKASGIRQKENSFEELWVDKHFPSSMEELAVHKRKVQELETWMKNTLNSKKPAPVLLLTGPSGVGKTTTLKVLAKMFKYDVQEWTNPLTSTFETFSDTWNAQVDGSHYESQVSLFKEFLLRASKYKQLDLLGCEQFQKKIILVEDYPNVFFQNPTSFQSIIQKYISTGLNPLVFIISDSASSSHNERLLFPSEFQHSIGMSHISFNPVALTILTKVLTKIALKESVKSTNKISMPSKTVLESIALSSNGDIRGAVNALQFSCLKDTSDLIGTFSRKHKQRSKSTSQLKQKHTTTSTDSSPGDVQSMPCIGGKDGSLFLFRALGKILYCKRETDSSLSKQSLLPAHLAHHERLPLLEIPEEVVDKSHMSGELFTTFLEQNYINFFHSIEDIECASEYLSDADIFTLDWSVRSTLQDYAVSIATRGIMHSNTLDKTKSSDNRMSFRPLHKPELYSVRRKFRDRYQASKDIFSFPILGASNEVLLTEIVPYMKLTNVTMHSPRQISFVNDICTFPKFHSRWSNLERLEDGDVSCMKSLLNTSDSKESSLSNSQSSDNTVTSDTEEIVIEEFDD